MTLDTARQAVFNTVELLEAIVVGLPAKNIFLIQRVSRTFRGVIASSTQIQQKLFWKPFVEPELWLLRGLEKENEPEYVDELSLDYELVPMAKNVTKVVGSPVQPVVLCPYIAHRYSELYDLAFMVGVCGPEEVAFDMAKLATQPGSWQNLQLLDPPCQSIEGWVELDLDTSPVRTYATSTGNRGGISLRSAEGITVGDILRAVMDTKQDIYHIRRSRRARKKTTTIRKIMSSARNPNGDGKLPCLHLNVTLTMKGVVLPTAEEWEQVRQNVWSAEESTES